MAKVARAFNTVNQRFAVGATIARSDIGPDEPLSYDRRVELGFIGDDKPAAQEPPEKPTAPMPFAPPAEDTQRKR